ncbi:MAG TPA: hypothetical protein DEG69_09030 [Flavobacteriaceae bacterium]|nr:hypothetical protein [Parvibaculum sp.]HBY67876.1 hypothetical protein [Flavobacteriaceae bacterium]|tara:strand:- start:853 stop:1323 length:471 start_codon:yes stop_codon:yes gene_type:complete
MDELKTELDNLSFPTQKRKNISKKKCDGFVLGYIIPRGKGRWTGTEPRLSSKSTQEKYIKIYNLLKQIAPPNFEYTSIQVNKNVKCGKHIDRYNKKDSAIIGLGDYTDGSLRIYDKKNNYEDIDIKNKFYIFNGSNYHETLDWTGTRYSVVYFSLK